MARPPKSLEQHVLDGTYRPDRHGPLPAKLAAWRAGTGPAPKTPSKPKGLSPEAAKFWDRVVKTRPGTVRESDGMALAMLCEWWGLWVNALAESRKTAVALDRVKVLTALGIAATNFDRLARKFGLTPVDRMALLPSEAEAAGPAAPKVSTRPKTKLDSQGVPG